jgi:protocatechuate 3,4-dioxygenase beta subunit
MRRRPRRVFESFSRLLLALSIFHGPALEREASTFTGAHGSRLTTSITGTVTDETGRPIPAATVERVGSSETRTRTDGAGRFRIPAVGECQDHVLKASRSGFAPEFLRVTPCGTASEARLTLHPGRVAFGTVVDESGRPVAGARVELALRWLDEAWPYRSRSGADGSFQIPDLPAGDFEPRVWHQGFPLLVGESREVSRDSRRIDLGRFVLRAGRRFAGRVLDPKGRPLSGVEVWTQGPRPQWGESRESGFGPTGLTARDGSFSVPFLPVTFVGFCQPGYRLLRVFAVVPPRRRRIVLLPAAPLPRISGRVLDESGRPIAGASVRREDPDVFDRAFGLNSTNACQGKHPVAQLSDGAGRFAFDLADGDSFDLGIDAPGYLREIRKVTSGTAAGGLEVVLRSGATIAGRVFAPDGSPVAGARVYAAQDDRTPQTVTDARGRFRLAPVMPGWRNVWADHPDHGEARRRLELVPGANPLDLTLDGQREPAISGRVVGLDGEPIAGVLIEGGGSSFYSRDDGSFRVVFPRGSLLRYGAAEALQLSREGYASSTYPFKPSDLPIEDLELRLETSHGLAGNILGVEPEQLAGVQISASRIGPSRAGTVSPDGTYRIDGLGSGSWTVEAWLANRVARKVVEIEAGDARADLELPKSREIRGRVLGLDGGPARASIVFKALGQTVSALAQDDGAFAVEVPPGSYTVSAKTASCQAGIVRKFVTVGDAPIEDLELRLEPGAVLRGRLLGLPAGVDASRAVSLSIAQTGQAVQALVEPDGTYRCEGLDRSYPWVEAKVARGELEASADVRITLRPDAETVRDLDVSEGTLTLSGHLTSGDEPLSAGITLLGCGQASCDEDEDEVEVEDQTGTDFRFPALRAGTYLLVIKDFVRDRLVERRIDLTADATVTIDLLRKK